MHSHDFLLLNTTMVLQGYDNRVLWRLVRKREDSVTKAYQLIMFANRKQNENHETNYSDPWRSNHKNMWCKGYKTSDPKYPVSRGLASHFEGIACHWGYDISEEDLGGPGVSVVNDRLSIRAIPAIHLHTAAPSLQSPCGSGQEMSHDPISSWSLSKAYQLPGGWLCG